MSLQRLFKDYLGFSFDPTISPSLARIDLTTIVLEYRSTDEIGSVLFDFDLIIQVCPSYVEDGFDTAVDFFSSYSNELCTDSIYYAEFSLVFMYSGRFSSGRKRKFNNVPGVVNILRDGGIFHKLPDPSFYSLLDGCSPISGSCQSNLIGFSYDYFDITASLELITSMALDQVGSMSTNLMSIILDDESSVYVSHFVPTTFDPNSDCDCSESLDVIVGTKHSTKCIDGICDSDFLNTPFLKSVITCDEEPSIPTIDIGEIPESGSLSLRVIHIGYQYTEIDGVITSESQDGDVVTSRGWTIGPNAETPSSAAQKLADFIKEVGRVAPIPLYFVFSPKVNTSQPPVCSPAFTYDATEDEKYFGYGGANFIRSCPTTITQFPDLVQELYAEGFLIDGVDLQSTLSNSSNCSSLSNRFGRGGPIINSRNGINSIGGGQCVPSRYLLRRVTKLIIRVNNNGVISFHELVNFGPGNSDPSLDNNQCRYCFSVNGTLQFGFNLVFKASGQENFIPIVDVLSVNSGTVCVNGPAGLDFASDFLVNTANDAIDVIVDNAVAQIATSVGGPIGSFLSNFVNVDVTVQNGSINC